MKGLLTRMVRQIKKMCPMKKWLCSGWYPCTAIFRIFGSFAASKVIDMM